MIAGMEDKKNLIVKNMSKTRMMFLSVENKMLFI